jgi:hypothetical protein
MKIDIFQALYSVAMILLAMVSALIVTKTIVRYWEKRKKP